MEIGPISVRTRFIVEGGKKKKEKKIRSIRQNVSHLFAADCRETRCDFPGFDETSRHAFGTTCD